MPYDINIMDTLLVMGCIYQPYFYKLATPMPRGDIRVVTLNGKPHYINRYGEISLRPRSKFRALSHVEMLSLICEHDDDFSVFNQIIETLLQPHYSPELGDFKTYVADLALIIRTMGLYEKTSYIETMGGALDMSGWSKEVYLDGFNAILKCHAELGKDDSSTVMQLGELGEVTMTMFQDTLTISAPDNKMAITMWDYGIDFNYCIAIVNSRYRGMHRSVTNLSDEVSARRLRDTNLQDVDVSHMAISCVSDLLKMLIAFSKLEVAVVTYNLQSKIESRFVVGDRVYPGDMTLNELYDLTTYGHDRQYTLEKKRNIKPYYKSAMYHDIRVSLTCE